MKIISKNKAGKGLMMVGSILTAIGVAGIITTKFNKEEDDDVDYTQYGDAIIEDDEFEDQETELI